MQSAPFSTILALWLFATPLTATTPTPREPVPKKEAGPVVGHYRGGSLHCAELAAVAASLPAGEGADRPRHALEELTVLRALADRSRATDLISAAETEAAFAAARERFLLRLMEERFQRGIEVSPSEIERAYEAHPERFERPEKISTRLILLRLPPDADTATREATAARLRTIRQQILDGASFVEMAKQHSLAENASRGGAVAASPRGTLLAAFEEVAWELEEGEVSDVVALPDGLALILLEKRFPALTRSLEEARAGLEKRLRQEKVVARREAALDAARQRWPALVDWKKGLLPAAEAREATVHFGGKENGKENGGETLTFADLRVRVHTPRRREQVEEALERYWLTRLAAEELSADERASLALLRLQIAAKPAIGPLLEAALPEVPEAELRRLYTKGRNLFREPEQRTMTALLIAAEKGGLRAARERALQARATWQATGTPPQDAGIVEPWGPLTRAMLDSHTSPRLAKRIFSLAQGEISEPLKLERYSFGSIHFQPEGYVVLRTEHIEPDHYQPFEEARGRVHRYAVRDRLDALSAQVKKDVLAAAALEADPRALAACPLPPPAVTPLRPPADTPLRPPADTPLRPPADSPLRPPADTPLRQQAGVR